MPEPRTLDLQNLPDADVVLWAQRGREDAFRELGGAIEKAIAALRPEYRSCIMLRHVEGRSYEEIAATLDLPLGTVKTYIHRARHQLREALGGERE